LITDFVKNKSASMYDNQIINFIQTLRIVTGLFEKNHVLFTAVVVKKLSTVIVNGHVSTR